MAPEGWSRVRLGEIAREVRDRLNPEEEPDLPYVGLADVEAERRRILDFGVLDDVTSLKTRFRSGDVLFGKLRPYLHKVAQADREGGASTDILVVRPRNGLDRDFLYWRLTSREVVRYAERHSAGTKMPRTSWARLAEFDVPLPPLAEQQRIAAILSSVDSAIAATRKVIEQTKGVKQGLLQTLMTRGIGHTRFKQTEIGEIPAPWEAVRLDDVATRGSGHTPSKRYPEYWDGDIKWVSLADSHALDRVYLSTTDKTITPEGIANSSAVVHPAGTVLVSRDASVGRSAIAARDLAVSQHFIAWQCGKRLNNHFLYYFLQHHKPELERIAVGSTIKTIGLNYFKRLRVPLPPRPEQDAIVETLLSCDRCVWAQESMVSASENLKRGLMQDLLTGRVRVNAD